MKILGIDYGKARIGLSISDESFKIAFPLEVVAAFHNNDKTVEAVIKVISKFQIQEIVIGLPLLMTGKDSPMSLDVRAFAKKLEEKTGIAVHLWDERLTSKQVEREMIDADMKRKKRAQLVDVMAATLILQSYLDAKNSA